LKRVEPVLRKKSYASKDVDVMFIMDCTGSMGSWIEVSKNEIKKIVSTI
jgi:hypothetical protein